MPTIANPSSETPSSATPSSATPSSAASSRAAPTVEIYTTPFCPYCHDAKALLKTKNVAFTEIDVSRDRALREAMTARAGGRTSVPQIFIGDVHVGGCDDLYALDGAGGLDPMLQASA